MNARIQQIHICSLNLLYKTKHLFFIFICFIYLSPSIAFSQERDTYDLFLNGDEKATLEDVISTSKTISAESQAKLKEYLKKWQQLESSSSDANVPQGVRDFIKKMNDAGLKSKIQAALNKFEAFDSGLKSLMDKKEKVDKIIYFYDRYVPDSENPFRSLEVLENAFTDAELLLPKEQKYEYITNTGVWLIRTGLHYFRDGVKNALGGLRDLQKAIKDRAGNCIGYVGGDATADSSDPKRKAFVDLGESTEICYTGVRPVGGEVWSDITGNKVFIWYAGKWTRLKGGLGTVNDIFDYWMLANGNAISGSEMIRWCNDLLLLYNNAKSWAESEYDKLSSNNDCHNRLLSQRNRKETLDQLMRSVGFDKKLFTAQYIFDKNNIRSTVKELSNIIDNYVLFEGKVEDQNDHGISNVAVEIDWGIQKKIAYTDQGGWFYMMAEIPEENRMGLPILIKASGSVGEYTDDTKIYIQCQSLGVFEIKSDKELIIQPQSSTINIGETVDFSVYFDDGENRIDVTSAALTNSSFKGETEGNFSVTATYQELAAVANIEVLGHDCGQNEVWDETVEDCVCQEGYKKNDQDICVEIEEPTEIECPDPNSEPVWDEALQKYICKCKENYVTDPTTGLCVEDVSALLNQSDCANAADAIAKWDPVNKIVICECTKGYHIWDPTQKKCVPDKQAILANSDCSAYPNTHPVWDNSLNEPICDCLPGYVWNKEQTKCIEGKAQQIANSDCSGYANTQPVWDDVLDEVICDCLPGYTWNKENTGCIPEWEEAIQNADCSAYPNTEPVWDPDAQEVYCDCKPGYEWDYDINACVRLTTENLMTEDCSQYPNTELIIDPSTGDSFCDCLPGYVWNSRRTGCVPERKKPNVDFGDLLTSFITAYSNASSGNIPGSGFNPNSGAGANSQPATVHQSNCNDKQEAGGDAPEVHNINLGQAFGTFIFDYETFTVKDQIIVSQGGQVIFNSGCVGESKSVSLQLNGFSSTISVRVNPNCDGTSSTQWNFTVHCPN